MIFPHSSIFHYFLSLKYYSLTHILRKWKQLLHLLLTRSTYSFIWFYNSCLPFVYEGTVVPAPEKPTPPLVHTPFFPTLFNDFISIILFILPFSTGLFLSLYKDVLVPPILKQNIHIPLWTMPPFLCNSSKKNFSKRCLPSLPYFLISHSLFNSIQFGFNLAIETSLVKVTNYLQCCQTQYRCPYFSFIDF